MATIYGYARVSTLRQKVERQIDNIKERFPDAVIIDEAYTGTSMDRPAWNRLYRKLEAGDTVVFDEISRMSRDAAEGFAVYKDLYNRGINLVFLKEPTLDTINFRAALSKQIEMTGDDIADLYIDATNKALMLLAERQIQAAFATAQHEVDFLHKRISEGVKKAQINGRRVGTQKGDTFTTKKEMRSLAIIRKHARDFGGSLTDKETMDLCGISRNTYYKYKRTIKNEALNAAVIDVPAPH